jgi:hypothetical protein
MAMKQFALDGQFAIVIASGRAWHESWRRPQGCIGSNNSPLPIPDY